MKLAREILHAMHFITLRRARVRVYSIEHMAMRIYILHLPSFSWKCDWRILHDKALSKALRYLEIKNVTCSFYQFFVYSPAPPILRALFITRFTRLLSNCEQLKLFFILYIMDHIAQLPLHIFRENLGHNAQKIRSVIRTVDHCRYTSDLTWRHFSSSTDGLRRKLTRNC